tara:strand:- start:2363 stop:3115 length:753 start_codon:yes stop_codon:yes gene_type:complete
MIHQCYFKDSQKSSLFTEEPYKGFGLEPHLFKSLSDNCPELESLDTRLALTEYSSFLHIWRNKSYDTDSWIGFTSYRQLFKSKFKFQNTKEVLEILKINPVACWGRYNVTEVLQVNGKLLSGSAAQAESAHPGLYFFIERIFKVFKETIPNEFYTSPFSYFANYWVMTRELFEDFMEWSWKYIEWCLNNKNNDEYLSSKNPVKCQENVRKLNSSGEGKAIGYFMERLFILWYYKRVENGEIPNPLHLGDI